MAPELLLGVLDQSPVAEGSTGADALRNTLDLARLADERGYSRYWVAEHHGGPMLAGTSPEALIGPIAATTSRLRVGSGGVMLPHYSPLKVAETFSVAERPVRRPHRPRHGRTDGTDDPVTAFALQRDRNHPAPDDFGEQLLELLGHLDDRLPADHPFAALPRCFRAAPRRPSRGCWAPRRRARSGRPSSDCPTPSPTSSTPAAAWSACGCIASASSRRRACGSPRLLVAVWALCADGDAEAERLSASARMAAMLARRGSVAPVPRSRRRCASCTGARATALQQVAASPWCRGARTVRAALQRSRRLRRRELLVVTVTHAHEARRRSYELLSDAFGLRGAAAPAPAVDVLDIHGRDP